MSKHALLALVILIPALTGCPNEEDDPIVPPTDLTGMWSFVADGASPPGTQACNGDLSMEILTPLCQSFTAFLLQDGTSVQGSSDPQSCEAVWNTTGTYTNDLWEGSMSTTEGQGQDQRIISWTFIGIPTGENSLQVEPNLLTVSEFPEDSCSMAGRYYASRTAVEPAGP